MKVVIDVSGLQFSAITHADDARRVFDEICEEGIADHAWLINHRDKTVGEYTRRVLKMGAANRG